MLKKSFLRLLKITGNKTRFEICGIYRKPGFDLMGFG